MCLCLRLSTVCTSVRLRHVHFVRCCNIITFNVYELRWFRWHRPYVVCWFALYWFYYEVTANRVNGVFYVITTNQNQNTRRISSNHSPMGIFTYDMSTEHCRFKSIFVIYDSEANIGFRKITIRHVWCKSGKGAHLIIHTCLGELRENIDVGGEEAFISSPNFSTHSIRRNNIAIQSFCQQIVKYSLNFKSNVRIFRQFPSISFSPLTTRMQKS